VRRISRKEGQLGKISERRPPEKHIGNKVTRKTLERRPAGEHPQNEGQVLVPIYLKQLPKEKAS